MVTTVTIKNIDQEIWRSFKSEATKQGQTMAEHFEQIVKENKNTQTWTEAIEVIEQIRKKAGDWSGTKEIKKWRTLS